MKKFFSFFAVAAFMSMMVACGGNDNEAKDGDENAKKGEKEVVENSAKQMTNVEKAISLTEDMLNIMQKEPSTETFEAMMKMTMEVENLSSQLTKEEEAEIEKYLSEKHPEMMNPEYQNGMTQEMQMKWANWAMEHQAEAEEITRRVMEMQ